MNAKDAAKWHRQEAQHLSALAERTAKDGNHVDACEWRDVAAHHALAARVLDALAVPGVAELLARIAARGRCDIPTATGTLTFTLEDADKTALRTLADAAKGTP